MTNPCPILSVLTAMKDIPRPLYVGCSGGRDSLVLAYGCLLLYRQGVLGQLPTLLHVHHGMQKANDEWAVFVGDWAKKWGFDCHILKLYLDKKNETQARAARYQALAQAMSDDGVLLVAHHADDQAETVLMRLIHGAGVQGLSGMRPWQTKQIKGRVITIHRPLLNVSRQAITMFAHDHALPYVNDPTNDMSDNARSLIRNEIFPRLTALNPKVKDNIARTAYLMNDVNDIVMDVVHDLYQTCKISKTNHPFVVLLDVTKVCSLTLPKQSALIRHYLQGDEVLPPNHQSVMDVMNLIHRTDGDHQTQVFWQANDGSYIICRYKDTLYRYRQELFALLKTHDVSNKESDKIILSHDKTPLKTHDACRLLFCLDKFWRLLDGDLEQMLIQSLKCQELSLKAVSTSDEVMVYQPYKDNAGQQQIAFQKFKGKKLYQTLNIPTWHRKNLWALCVNEQPILLMTMEKSWLLNSDYFYVLINNFDDRWHELIEVAVDRPLVC